MAARNQILRWNGLKCSNFKLIFKNGIQTAAAIWPSKIIMPANSKLVEGTWYIYHYIIRGLCCLSNWLTFRINGLSSDIPYLYLAYFANSEKKVLASILRLSSTWTCLNSCYSLLHICINICTTNNINTYLNFAISICVQLQSAASFSQFSLMSSRSLHTRSRNDVINSFKKARNYSLNYFVSLSFRTSLRDILIRGSEANFLKKYLFLTTYVNSFLK